VEISSNWYEHFFHGVAVDLWLKALPAEHTRNEAHDIERLMSVPPGAAVLDVPCGAGRISLELAARGYRVTGVDLSSESLQHARAADPDRRVAWEERDMRDLPWPGRFDAAFCVGNSFGYLDDDGNRAFLESVARALKRGGKFVLETPMVIESLLPQLKDRPWYKAGDIYLLVRNDYDASRGRLDIEYTFVSNGRVEVRHGTHRAYTYRQLHEIVEAAGFSVTLGKAWDRASHTLTLIGTRR
jgi:SAM-dependent methyltransferase